MCSSLSPMIICNCKSRPRSPVVFIPTLRASVTLSFPPHTVLWGNKIKPDLSGGQASWARMSQVEKNESRAGPCQLVVKPFGPRAVDLSTLIHAWPENVSAFVASIQESFAGRNCVNCRAGSREGHHERLCCDAQVVTRGREGNLQWLYALAQGLCLCYKSLVGLANVPCRESKWVVYCDSDQTAHAVPQFKWSALLFLILLTCLGNNYSYMYGCVWFYLSFTMHKTGSNLKTGSSLYLVT